MSNREAEPSLGYLTRKDTEVKLPRPTRVKNKTPAPIQITAEQILREARERQEAEIRPPKQKITDPTELADYRLRKRKEFEDLIRRVRWNISVWIKYAQWEESQKDFKRARSVWERAIEVDYKNHTLWLKYAEVEMKNKFINHARNVWDRAVSLLPRIDQLWYKYIHMEEMLSNVAGARQIYERWMNWMPDQQGWLSYIKFELRYNEIERARGIFERFMECHPKVSAWIKFAKFEMKNGEIARARNCYERAVEKLADDEDAEMLFVAFSEFEERCKETERARCIYKFALDHIPKGRAEDLYRKFVAFEKQYGDKEGIEDAIVGKRRFQYEDEVRKNPMNYDTWFDYIRLEESVANKERIRDVYERAIANVPPAQEKRYWQRYIYLWINYALFEELDAADMERARDVYRECLNLIPHEKFSFAKIWLLAAQFEIRQLNLKGARQILGNAIGRAPKDKIFKKYIEIELQLGNMDRCRRLYEKYLEWAPENCYAWSKFAELERSLCETERARAIFELAITQPSLDMPELLWKRRGNNSTVDSVDETNGEPMELPDEITTDTEVHFTKRTRKSTSLVWKEFNKLEEADDTVKHLQCVHCGRKMTKSSSGSTTHLTRHLKACLRRQASQASQTTLNFQPADSKMEVASTFNGKYDHAKQREATAHWILMHEKPFSVTEEEGFTFMMQVNQPLYQRIPRSQSKRDCVSVYDIEKKKLKSVLQEVSKISLTTDLWKSDSQQISYMCLTGHFVDKDWKLQKRVLNFVDVPPPHGGYEIADALYKCLQEWEIDSKVCAIAVDNASYNDVAVRIVRDTVDLTRKLPLDGKLFHTRCAAHILNLMVQDGLSVIAEIVSSIHNSVAYINKTEGRILKFAEVVKQLQIPARKLIIDCPTRWNSTYEMLVSALNFKNAFSIFKGRDTGYKLCPTDEDWEKVENVCDVLGVFYDVTQVISGSEYPTANLFLSEIYRVKEVLDEHLMSEHLYIQMMVEKMLLKFKKYWGECNMLMALGAVLDPRFKMMLIEFAFPILYSGEDSSSHVEGVKKALYDLYSHYVAEAYPSAPGDMVGLGSEGSSSSAVPSTTSTGRSKNGRDRASGRSKFNNYLKASENIVPVKSELDTYLEEGVLIEPSNSESDSRHVEKFEVFQWWKTNKLRFRVLSRMAIDILSIPITTVASESTFSAGSRVIDDYRAKLGTETVQVCICGADWVRHLHGVKKKSRENKVIDVVLPIN